MRKELLYVAATMALVIGLGAGVPNWKGVAVRTDLPGNTSSVSSITFAGGVTAAQFVGSGSLLTGVLKPPDTNGYASTADLTSTNQYWDVDTLTAPATSGSIVYDDPGGGDPYENLSIAVYPIYSNAIGRVFGTPLTDQQNIPMAYYRWTWDAQPGAVGYFVHIHNFYPPESDKYVEQAGTSIIVSEPFSGDDITPKPSTVARTNDIPSSFIATTTNFDTFVPWSATGALHNPVIQSTNWTAYADQQFPVWSPPYFSNIRTALHWLAQGPDGTRTNHAILKITGMHRLSGKTYTLNDDALDFLSIDAGESTVWADVSQCSDVKGCVTLGSRVDHVQVKGGKWIGYQDSNKNGTALKMEGKYCGLIGVDGITEGSNWNATSAIQMDGFMGYMLGCMARIGTNASGRGNYSPLVCCGSSSLIMNCVFDFSQKPNSFFHLGQDQGKKGFQYVDCKFKFVTSGSDALFIRVSAMYKWINCIFANATNAANQWPVIGRTGDVATTNFVINCVFNQQNWFTNCIMISNNVSVADETTGFDGVLLTPPD